MMFGEQIKTVVDEVRKVYDPAGLEKPFYEYGHPVEIIDTLAEKSNEIFMFKKYPLIALFLDVGEKRKGILRDVDDFIIMVVTDTLPEYKAAQRTVETFEPTLMPLAMEFVKQLDYSPLFSWKKEYHIIPHYFWGKEAIYGSDGNVFDDYLDAVEIKIKNLKILNQC